ncbi:acyl-CoA synthetase [Microbacterium sp. 179-B 1A2 NHS]|uniref:acyl-CoA synthetase n=1 Tax=Microbacterium sp. 179-B 1A2 NHS TaxID=3142383 RepID=UPI0039A35342
MPDASPRTFEVRHLQMARALFAAIAAVMITFSIDHSAGVGVAVFSGFTVATGLVLLLAVWLVFRAGARWPSMILGLIMLAAGMIGSIPTLRTTEGFFILVMVWAFIAGAAELTLGLVGRRQDTPAAREAVFVGALTLVLAVALIFIDRGYNLEYYIDDAQRSFSLTGITIGVGVFGGYAAIVAVYLGIAAFSPRPAPAVTADPAHTTGGTA